MNSLAAKPMPKPIDILLVEDDLGDVLLTKKALENSDVCSRLTIAKDGIEALSVLRKHDDFANARRPDLILLDLNMPRMDGRELLTEIKRDENLRSIPVIILTTSDSDQDVAKSYDLQASCYVTKPVDLKRFTYVVQAINDFWNSVVKLPPQ